MPVPQIFLSQGNGLKKLAGRRPPALEGESREREKEKVAENPAPGWPQGGDSR